MDMSAESRQQLVLMLLALLGACIGAVIALWFITPHIVLIPVAIAFLVTFACLGRIWLR